LTLTSRARRLLSQFGTDPTINQTMNDRYVAITDPVVAPFDQTHTYHSFIITTAVILLKAPTSHDRPGSSRFGMDLTINYIMNMRYVVVADPIVAYFCFTYTNHLFIIVM
jgi:hypothetical protein